MQCHVLLYKLQKGRTLENIHIFYQSVLISVQLFSLLTQRRRHWKEMGWGKSGEQAKPATTTKRPPRIWEAAKPTSGENIMRFVQYMWNIFCPCDVTSVTSDVNLNCPFSTCAICYPRGCHPEAYIFQVLVNEKQCLPPPGTPSLRIM